jgi:hypothetical protein
MRCVRVVLMQPSCTSMDAQLQRRAQQHSSTSVWGTLGRTVSTRGRFQASLVWPVGRAARVQGPPSNKPVERDYAP